jgi:hypothetical protein
MTRHPDQPGVAEQIFLGVCVAVVLIAALWFIHWLAK